MSREPDQYETGGFTFEAMDTPQNQRVRSTAVLIDLRREVRVDTRFPAEVFTETGMSVPAIVSNLSRSGLQLEGSRQMVETLFPGHSPRSVHTAVPVLVAFALPGATTRPVAVQVQCNSVYVRQSSPDCWHIGMQFAGFVGGRDSLYGYLSSILARP
ncbi:MAG: hypothetical protein PVJ66_01830 [Gammaproteobacteria bacterium]|jgi:hypothetical protein